MHHGASDGGAHGGGGAHISVSVCYSQVAHPPFLVVAIWVQVGIVHFFSDWLVGRDGFAYVIL